MPRTKLDRVAIPLIEVEKRIIHQAMSRNGIYSNKDLAKLLGLSVPYITTSFSGGFSAKQKQTMQRKFRFKFFDYEWAVLTRGDKDAVDNYWRCVSCVSLCIPASAESRG